MCRIELQDFFLKFSCTDARVLDTWKFKKYWGRVRAFLNARIVFYIQLMPTTEDLNEPETTILKITGSDRNTH